MTELTPWLRILMDRELATLRRELALYPSDDMLWTAPPGFTNPAGNLMLHVCGNLRHFLGAVLGKDGYVRDREREFSVRGRPRAEVEQELVAAQEVVDAVLPTLTAMGLAERFPVEVGGVRPPMGLFLLHLEAHLAFHVGQVGTLRRVLTGESTSADPMALGPLGDC